MNQKQFLNFVQRGQRAQAAIDTATFEEPRHLWFRVDSGRYVLEGQELHCGDCFQVRIDGKWLDVRIELAGKDHWYLVGHGSAGWPTLNGLEARRYL